VLAWLGQHQDNLEWYESLEADGHEVKAMDSRPTMDVRLSPYWRAFNDLSNSRSVGFTAGYIHYSEICCWLNENHITMLEHRLEYIRWVQTIDRHYLNLHHKAAEKKNA
jgi:hypothetical protein